MQVANVKLRQILPRMGNQIWASTPQITDFRGFSENSNALIDEQIFRDKDHYLALITGKDEPPPTESLPLQLTLTIQSKGVLVCGRQPCQERDLDLKSVLKIHRFCFRLPLVWF